MALEATFVVGVGEAAERIVAGRHYYSDNLAGAIVGTAIGITVPILHHRKTPSQVSVVPTTGGAEVVWKKNF